MNRAAKIISNILYVLCMLAYIAIFVWRAMEVYSDEVLCAILWLAVIVISALTASILHECGHALFGLFSGVRARLGIRSVASFFKPSSVDVIPKTDKNLKSRLIVTSLGGVTVNFLFVVFGILALAMPQIPMWLSGVIVAHLSLFFDNVFPIEHKTGKTDGLVIAELIKNEDSAKVMLAVLTVQAQVLNGKPIAEVDEKLLFDLPQIQEDDPAFISLTELRSEYFAVKGDIEQAQKYKSRFEQLKEDYLN